MCLQLPLLECENDGYFSGRSNILSPSSAHLVHAYAYFNSIVGSEWDYVIISLVRSLKKDEIDPEPTQSWLRERLGFLTDEHQMNVGLTRARRGLCIIGKKYSTLSPVWPEALTIFRVILVNSRSFSSNLNLLKCFATLDESFPQLTF